MVVKSFSRQHYPTKNVHQRFYGRYFLWLENHFHESSHPKFSSKFFHSSKNFHHNNLVEFFFYDCNIISSKTGSYQKCSSKIVYSKIVMVAKSIFPKKIPTKTLHQK